MLRLVKAIKQHLVHDGESILGLQSQKHSLNNSILYLELYDHLEKRFVEYQPKEFEFTLNHFSSDYILLTTQTQKAPSPSHV